MAGCTALVVDDDADICLLARTTWHLADARVQVTGWATSPEEALELWRSTSPDVVVLDYSMPGRNGIDVAAEMLAERPGQRVVLCSAYLNADVKASAAEIGVGACVEKDVFMTDLPRMLAQMI